MKQLIVAVVKKDIQNGHFMVELRDILGKDKKKK